MIAARGARREPHPLPKAPSPNTITAGLAGAQLSTWYPHSRGLLWTSSATKPCGAVTARRGTWPTDSHDHTRRCPKPSGSSPSHCRARVPSSSRLWCSRRSPQPYYEVTCKMEGLGEGRVFIFHQKRKPLRNETALKKGAGLEVTSGWCGRTCRAPGGHSEFSCIPEAPRSQVMSRSEKSVVVAEPRAATGEQGQVSTSRC